MSDKIEKSIDLKASLARVWRALTDYKEFGTWFGVNLETPFIVGEITRGLLTYPGLEHVVWEATIKVMDHEKLFALTWRPYADDPKVDYSGGPTTLVEFKIEQIEGGTRLVIIESGFEGLEEKHRILCLPRNESGWTQQIVSIQSHVES